jgi:hypothetical protein
MNSPETAELVKHQKVNVACYSRQEIKEKKDALLKRYADKDPHFYKGFYRLSKIVIVHLIFVESTIKVLSLSQAQRLLPSLFLYWLSYY